VATGRCHPTRHGWCGSWRPAQPGHARPPAAPAHPWRPRRRRPRPRHQPPGRRRPLGTRRPSGHPRSGSGSRRRRLGDPEGHGSFEQITLHPQPSVLALQVPSRIRASLVSPSASPRSMRSWRTQFPNVESSMPNSRAISAIGRPVLPTRSTASRLNSLVNPRRVRCGDCLCSSPMRTSSHPRCPASGGRSTYPPIRGCGVGCAAGGANLTPPAAR
jgi:hypothetical protein